jgi:CheY-like chemotaxis protein
MQRGSQNHILVVEDNDDLRTSITEILALNGFLASGAEHGKAALDQLYQSPIPPALILLDLNMPVMDGMTLMQRLKEIPNLRHIPIVLMTAQPVPSPLDVEAVLPKPFAGNALLSLVERFVANRRRKNAATKRKDGVAVRVVRP